MLASVVTLRNGDCLSATLVARRSDPSNAASPVELANWAITIDIDAGAALDGAAAPVESARGDRSRERQGGGDAQPDVRAPRRLWLHRLDRTGEVVPKACPAAPTRRPARPAVIRGHRPGRRPAQ